VLAREPNQTLLNGRRLVVFLRLLRRQLKVVDFALLRRLHTLADELLQLLQVLQFDLLLEHVILVQCELVGALKQEFLKFFFMRRLSLFEVRIRWGTALVVRLKRIKDGNALADLGVEGRVVVLPNGFSSEDVSGSLGPGLGLLLFGEPVARTGLAKLGLRKATEVVSLLHQTGSRFDLIVCKLLNFKQFHIVLLGHRAHFKSSGSSCQSHGLVAHRRPLRYVSGEPRAGLRGRDNWNARVLNVVGPKANLHLLYRVQVSKRPEGL